MISGRRVPIKKKPFSPPKRIKGFKTWLVRMISNWTKDNFFSHSWKYVEIRKFYVGVRI